MGQSYLWVLFFEMFGPNFSPCVPRSSSRSHDVKSLKLLENRIFGARESHRIVIEVTPERAPMGKVVKDHGGILL